MPRHQSEVTENFFQDEFIKLIKENALEFKKQMKKYSNENQIKIWQFIFDGYQIPQKIPSYVTMFKTTDSNFYDIALKARDKLIIIKKNNSFYSILFGE